MLGRLRHSSHLRIHPATWLQGGRASNGHRPRSLYVRVGCARCERALALAEERSVAGHRGPIS